MFLLHLLLLLLAAASLNGQHGIRASLQEKLWSGLDRIIVTVGRPQPYSDKLKSNFSISRNNGTNTVKHYKDRICRLKTQLCVTVQRLPQ
ncbi:hypothetical protein NFI96_032626 [Prochilodus magdalenae]|nr:hypothetical protein NFI96_032626 [Prochilodus magdalenae]